LLKLATLLQLFLFGVKITKHESGAWWGVSLTMSRCILPVICLLPVSGTERQKRYRARVADG